MEIGEPFTFFVVATRVITDTLIPITIIVCFVITAVAIRNTSKVDAPVGFRYVVYAIASFVFSLALPFLAFPFRLVFESFNGPGASDILLVISTAAIVCGTFWLVKGTRMLRSDANAH